MRSLVNKSIKPIMMIVLTCLVALCFTGCASKSAELAKDGNFDDLPLTPYQLEAHISGEEAIIMAVLNGVDEYQQSHYSPYANFSLIYLDENGNPMFLDNGEAIFVSASLVYDDEYYGKVQKNGIPQYVQVYLSQLESSESSEMVWGFSSEALGKMEDSDYLDAAVDTLKENAIDCGVVELS